MENRTFKILVSQKQNKKDTVGVTKVTWILKKSLQILEHEFKLLHYFNTVIYFTRTK